MNSFQHAGEALLQAQEGNRLIGLALAEALQNVARRLAEFFAAALSRTPGPHRLR